MEHRSENPASLKPNPMNPNRVGPENMLKLRRSIEDLGFFRPVVCRELADGSLQTLAGHHRVEIAIDLGLKSVPVINVGRITDQQAQKIGLADNGRYGTDDSISLAKVYEEIGLSSEELAAFLPYSEADFDTVKRVIDIDLDELDIIVDDDEPTDPEDVRAPKPARTHEMLQFRVSLGDAERIRQLIEKTMKRQGFSDGNDDLTAAGLALAHVILSEDA